jgi:hypothetical protein
MKQRIEGRSGAMGSKTIIVIVALVVVVAAVATVLVINWTSDNNNDRELHTHMSVGGKITYETVEGGSSVFELEVVGTNVYNYALDVSPISSLLGTSLKYQTFNIDTGELRFAENEGVSTAVIDGESVELKSFEVTDSDRVKWTFFTRADLKSEVPLMFECQKGDLKLKAELRSTELEYDEHAPHDGETSSNFVRSNSDTVQGNVRIFTVTETYDVMMIGEDTLKVHLSLVTESDVFSGAETDRYNTISYTCSTL